MAFPDLTLRPDSLSPTGLCTLWAEATGVPDNGANTFAIPFVLAPALGGSGLDPDYVDEDWLVIEVIALGSSITAVALGSPLLNEAKTEMTLNFTQGGADEATVIVRLVHTLQR